MKRRIFEIAVLFSVLIMFTVGFTACSGKSKTEITIGGKTPERNEEQNDVSEVKNEAFSFVSNNVKITPNDLMAPLVSALGDDYEYTESPSCAYVGLDKVYVYKGFIIYTYPDNDVDHVLLVELTDDSVKTPEGLMIGDSAEKVIEKYGDKYEEKNGSYAYVKGKTKLVFIVRENRVTSIQYCLNEAK